MKQPLVIAIDGPAGAGKSTVARKLAKRLRLAYVDSGATYRAAALWVLQSGADPKNERDVEAAIEKADITILTEPDRVKVLLNGQDVTSDIRTPEVTSMAARVARLRQVRNKLVHLQRSFAVGRGVVMEGRDIGTIVFPSAPLKIFLDAASRERARRRLEQNLQQGTRSTLDETAEEIAQRDQLDAERDISPLVAAPDAMRLDSTDLTAEEVVERILEFARQKKLLENEEA